MTLDWHLRTALPTWLDLAGLTAPADTLREFSQDIFAQGGEHRQALDLFDSVNTLLTDSVKSLDSTCPYTVSQALRASRQRGRRRIWRETRTPVSSPALHRLPALAALQQRQQHRPLRCHPHRPQGTSTRPLRGPGSHCRQGVLPPGHQRSKGQRRTTLHRYGPQPPRNPSLIYQPTPDPHPTKNLKEGPQ